jgi:hypothetical protein
MRTLLASAALIAAMLPATAAEVRDCDFAASLQTLVEPWEKNIRTFYDGKVRVARVDTWGEPACCSTHLLIMIPNNDPTEHARICKVVGDKGTNGFQDIQFNRIKTRYDAGRGLLIEFPYKRYVDGVRFQPGGARVRVNLERGTVTVE